MLQPSHFLPWHRLIGRWTETGHVFLKIFHANILSCVCIFHWKTLSYLFFIPRLFLASSSCKDFILCTYQSKSIFTHVSCQESFSCIFPSKTIFLWFFILRPFLTYLSYEEYFSCIFSIRFKSCFIMYFPFESSFLCIFPHVKTPSYLLYFPFKCSFFCMFHIKTFSCVFCLRDSFLCILHLKTLLFLAFIERLKDLCLRMFDWYSFLCIFSISIVVLCILHSKTLSYVSSMYIRILSYLQLLFKDYFLGIFHLRIVSYVFFR